MTTSANLRQALTALAEWDNRPRATTSGLTALCAVGYMVEHKKGWSLTAEGRAELKLLRAIPQDLVASYIDEKVSAGELF